MVRLSRATIWNAPGAWPRSALLAVKQAAIRVEQLRNQARLEVEDAVIALKRSQASLPMMNLICGG